MPKVFFKAAVVLLTLAFALPAVTAPALAVEKTEAKAKKVKKKSPCGKEECMKAAPSK